MTALTLRDARPGDEPRIAAFVRGLAEVEGRPLFATATVEAYAAMLFGPDSLVRAVLAELDGVAVGFAFWFLKPGTYTGTPGLFVEDVFVDRAYRGRGYGRAILRHLARTAIARGCDRVEWHVLRENLAAMAFYRRIEAQRMDDVLLQRLSGDALRTLAG